MKQYDVEISAMAGLGYTDCSEFITSVNLSVASFPELGGDDIGPIEAGSGSAGFCAPWSLAKQ